MPDRRGLYCVKFAGKFGGNKLLFVHLVFFVSLSFSDTLSDSVYIQSRDCVVKE